MHSNAPKVQTKVIQVLHAFLFALSVPFFCQPLNRNQSGQRCTDVAVVYLIPSFVPSFVRLYFRWLAGWLVSWLVGRLLGSFVRSFVQVLNSNPQKMK